jgi:hypothetical protein
LSKASLIDFMPWQLGPYSKYFLAPSLAPLLSQNNLIRDYSILIIPRIAKNFLSHTASFAASHAATYSAFIVESVIQDCFTLVQLMALSLRVKTYPEVDFWESLLTESQNLCNELLSNPHIGRQVYNPSFSEDTLAYVSLLPSVVV